MERAKSSSCYCGRYAQLYDLFYKDKPYKKEVAFLDSCLQKNLGSGKKKILELACGTGRHAIEFARLHHTVIATDASHDMLTQARRKAQLAKVAVEFRQQDMRYLSVSERPFDAILCLFDSVGHVITNGGICKTFGRVASHLRCGGLFICEFWHGAAMVRSYEPVRIRYYDADEQRIVRISETTMDCVRQVCHVQYTIYEFRTDGGFSSLVEHQDNRFFFVQEMAVFLNMVGLQPLAWHAGFESRQEITRDTWHVVVIARKAKEKRAHGPLYRVASE
jgi:SAM-dependent methyltransferase